MPNKHRTMLINSVLRIWFAKFRQSFKDIRWSRLWYMLIFAHAPLFSNIQEVYFRSDQRFAGVDAVTWMRLTYCIGAGWLFVFATQKNMGRYAKVLASGCALFFILWIVQKNDLPAVVFACLFTLLYGGCAAIMIYYYSYALNDAERFFGASLTSLYYVIFQLILSSGVLTVLMSRLYVLGLVAVTVFCIFHYRDDDLGEEPVKPKTRDNKQIGLMLYFFFAYHIVEMFYTYIQGISDRKTLFLNGAVGVAVFIAATYLYFRAKFNLWHMCNIFFFGFLIAYALRITVSSGPLLFVSRAFRGLEQIGFIAAYTLLGSVLQKNVSFRSFKRILIATLNTFFLTYIALGVLIPRLPVSLPLLAALVACIFFAGFMLMSPIYADYLYQRNRVSLPLTAGKQAAAEAAETAETAEAAEAAEAAAQEPDSQAFQNHVIKMMNERHLTPRESEVIITLLQGSLYKECADQLGISIDTVKFHTRNAYRKLGVNGRSDLFSIFFNDQAGSGGDAPSDYI